MAQNKVQYQHGLPILEFFKTYGSHEQCEALVRLALAPRLRVPALRSDLAQ